MSVIWEGTILIARRECTAELQDRVSGDPAVRVYSAADAHAALTTAMKHRVPVVVLDRRFAASAVGNQFVTELRTSCRDVEIRILEESDGELPPVLQRPIVGSARAAIARHSQLLKGPVRRATRYPVPPGCALIVNGETTELVNVSEMGAQLVSPSALRPDQQVRLVLADHAVAIKVEAAVAWSAFERSAGASETCYRVGLEFAQSKPEIVRVYCKEPVDVE